MISILFIHQSSDLYGSDKTLLLLLQQLDKKKYTAVVVLPLNGPLKEELEKIGVKVIISPVLKLYRNIFTPKNIVLFFNQLRTSLKTIKKLDDEYHFDIIYSNTLAVLLGAIYSRKAKIKHIWHVHEIIVHPKIIAKIFPKLLRKYADVVVCNSSATKNNLIVREPNLASKSIVILNGIEFNTNTISSLSKSEIGFKQNDCVITLAGRISRLKGHKWLLNTFTNYFSAYDNVKLLFVGSPVLGQEYYLSEIEQKIAENKLEDKVKILPFTKDLNAIWNITDIAVMPSTEAESFGLVAVEAMYAQKPVIGSDLGGLKEIIQNNETGFLIEPNNEEAFSKALTTLIENPELRDLFGQKGHQRVKEEFSLDRYVKQFEVLFAKST
ncbi:MAG: glycosyltransferase family 4 protein [Flavobacteriales bacterium]|nr:glycosyltransferase family 4 protein [Flavobacteriales bacterium]